MTGNDRPANPSVLNTTVLSNFAYIDQLWVVAGLSGICTVPVVREELEHGVDNHPYLQEALETLDDEIPVATISDTVANREAVVGGHLDPGEAQAFALADAHDGRLLTDDGDALRLLTRRGHVARTDRTPQISAADGRGPGKRIIGDGGQPVHVCLFGGGCRVVEQLRCGKRRHIQRVRSRSDGLSESPIPDSG